jgi:hypothetical protein
MKTLMLSFQFNQDSDARLALDSLLELGFHPTSFSINHNTVDLHVDLESSTPSLEIMLAHGGELVVDEHSPSVDKVFSQAYQLDSYSDENKSTENADVTDSPDEEEFPLIDPYVAIGYDEQALPKDDTKRMF